MHREETSFIYNIKQLPNEIMSHQEYCNRRDQAIKRLVDDRLATKGHLRLVNRMDPDRLGAGIPLHQRQELTLRQFERYAADQFTGQFDKQCNTCQHCKLTVNAVQNHSALTVEMIAECYCTAMKFEGAECFDGYMPKTRQWRWQSNLEPSMVEFDLTAFGDELKAEMTIIHDTPVMNYADTRLAPLHHALNAHDEPEGIMVRNNADSSYLTQSELKMANQALARTAKKYRATQPTPQPATPMDDAW